MIGYRKQIYMIFNSNTIFGLCNCVDKHCSIILLGCLSKKKKKEDTSPLESKKKGERF